MRAYRKFRLGTIRSKMLAYFGVTIFLLFALLGSINYYRVGSSVVSMVKDLSKEVLLARSQEIGRLMHSYINDIDKMADYAVFRRGDFEEITQEILSSTSKINPDYEILFYADKDGNFITSEGVLGNISDRDYYKAIFDDNQQRFVSQTMVSRSTDAQIFVVASAVYDLEGEKIGIIASTVLLETLSNIVGSISIDGKGFGYVTDNNTLLIAHPRDDLRMSLVFTDSDRLGYKGLEEIGHSMSVGSNGFMTYSRPNGGRFITVFSKIPNTPNWNLGVAIDESELMAKPRSLTRFVLISMIGIFVVVIAIIVVLSNRISKPILELKSGVDVLRSGNLDHLISIPTGDEIESLGEAFNNMTKDLKTYIENLRITTEEKQRIEGELLVAQRIQSSMLPITFPPYPNLESTEVYAIMEPAREVGGDFYDFYLIDKDKFCFCIGDVSGKGIPAALFMVITRTILKNQALQGSSLDEIFYITNNMLCNDNPESMFVTVFMGIIDVQAGTLEYINAGHNPPLIARDGSTYDFLNVDNGLVLGGIEDYPYKVQRTDIDKGDRLLIYTDGVTEAMNARGELYGEKRLIQSIKDSCDTVSVKGTIETVMKDIEGFVQGTPPSDDITMMAIRFKGYKGEEGGQDED